MQLSWLHTIMQLTCWNLASASVKNTPWLYPWLSWDVLSYISFSLSLQELARHRWSIDSSELVCMNVSIVHATLCVQLRILPQEHTVVGNALFLGHPQQLDNRFPVTTFLWPEPKAISGPPYRPLGPVNTSSFDMGTPAGYYSKPNHILLSLL